jgi:hypothetical protein
VRYAHKRVDSKRLTSCADLREFGDLSFGLGDALNLFNSEACQLAAGRLRKAKSSSQKNGSGAGVRSTKGNIALRLWLSGPRIGWFRPLHIAWPLSSRLLLRGINSAKLS